MCFVCAVRNLVSEKEVVRVCVCAERYLRCYRFCDNEKIGREKNSCVCKHVSSCMSLGLQHSFVPCCQGSHKRVWISQCVCGCVCLCLYKYTHTHNVFFHSSVKNQTVLSGKRRWLTWPAFHTLCTRLGNKYISVIFNMSIGLLANNRAYWRIYGGLSMGSGGQGGHDQFPEI